VPPARPGTGHLGPGAMFLGTLADWLEPCTISKPNPATSSLPGRPVKARSAFSDLVEGSCGAGDRGLPAGACTEFCVTTGTFTEQEVGFDHRGEQVPLFCNESFVHELECCDSAVDWEYVREPGNTPQALVTPPVTITAWLPQDHKPGSKLTVQGPHGPLVVTPPLFALAGSRLRFKLRAPPEFIIQVPPGHRSGSTFKFTRPDGVEVSVQVPKNLRPGDSFEASPPALLIRVPDGVSAGSAVVFQLPGHEANSTARWCRTEVPKGSEPGDYFAICLPVDGDEIHSL